MESIPLISIDVSKGKSHVCGFRNKTVKFGKVFIIEHNLGGFNQLLQLRLDLKNDCLQEPHFIYESTGIYHRPLRTFLDNHHLSYSEVSPLLSAKHRKNSSIRSAKTDSRDTQSLANLYYDLRPEVSTVNNEAYHELSQLNRYHESMTAILVKLKVHFNEKMDVLFPRFRKEISDKVYELYYLELFKELSHPELLSKKRIDSIETILAKNGMRKSRARNQAEKIKAYAHNCYPGSDVNSVDCLIFTELIQQLQGYSNRIETIIERMTEIALQLPLFTQLLSIPGIGPKLAVKLIAELGDLSRFERTKQLIAYAGLDPTIYQSGNQDGKGLSISKKGNKYLRKSLYQAVSYSLKTTDNHSIKECYQKKKQTSSHKSALIASCDKLLRIIFKINQTGELFHL